MANTKKVTKAKNVDELKSITEDIKEKDNNNNVAAVIRKGKVNCDNLRLRAEPNVESNIIKLLQKDNDVEILEDANEDFYKVKGGFVMKQFIDIYEK